MLAEDQQVLHDALSWAEQGQKLWLVSVARTWGTAPRPVGSWAVIAADGRLSGSVSGGCIEDDLVARMRAGELDQPLPFLLKYGISADEAHRFGLPCGGSLQLVVEPAPVVSMLADLAQRLAAGERLLRCVDLATGAVVCRAVLPGDEAGLNGEQFRAVLGPRWRLLIVGAGQIARYLAPMAQAVGFEVTVCDPRFEAEAAWDKALAPMVRDMPDDYLLQWARDPHSAVVAVSHDPRIDDMLLLEALKSNAFLIGAIGSQKNQGKRRERLLGFDLSPAQINRLRGPVGLDIGSKTPPEIAVSIVAELVAVRSGKRS